ncbi:MAG: hypothetical protein PHP30_02425 [Bacteroidales bacterium]|nr:hypothetical protein [Bacteroidales bacterium]MDD2425252.1 hypothetical protein [Bacteroidales bacterium]MDD3988941.1 hypothetical protein [Bacteroidales bacterium]MDD4638218.1 hypothetical protein [Bacteroidales bacterium]
MKYNNKYILMISALALSQLCFILPLTGQNRRNVQERCLYHFEDLQKKQTWTDSYNAAGLHFIDFRSSSLIEAYMGKNDGGLVKYYESDNSYNFGLRTYSYKKIKNTTFYGKLDYNNYKGKNTSWSGLIYPERYLLSVANDRPADLVKESYKLSGGISTQLTEDLFFGLQINYETADAAKRKDLRHRTRLLDFETTAGLAARSDHMNIGLNYYYRKFYETVAFSKIADDDIIYNGYLFKGIWFGIFTTWTQEVLELSRPFTDVLHGGSLQLELVADNFKFFNEFTYKNQSELTGEGKEKAFSEAKADIYEYKGRVQYESGNIRQYLKLNTNYSDAVNYDKVTTQEKIGGYWFTFYYGLNRAFSKRSFDLNAEYNIAFGRYKCNPSFDLKAGYNYISQAALSSLVNPFYFTQDFKINTGYLKARKNFTFNKGMLDINLGAVYGKGSGNKLTQHISSTAIGNVSEDIIPQQHEDLLNREFEYLTARKFQGSVGAKVFRFVSMNKQGGSIYLDANYTFLKAFDVQYQPEDRSGFFTIALGYAF